MNITRSNNKMIAGVASGLARALNIDPTLVRLGFVLVSIFAGGGVLLYIVLWVVMPRDDGTAIADEGFSKARTWYEEHHGPKPPTH